MQKLDKAAGPFDFFLLLLLGILWGIPYALTKIALTTIPPITMVAARVLLAAISLWIVVWLAGGQKPKSWSFVPQLCVQGVLACLIPYTLIALGQQSVDSSLAAILNSTAPLFVCVIGLAWSPHEHLGGGKWFGVALGLCGVVLIVGVDSLSRATAGQLLILAATCSSAIGVIYGRRLYEITPELAAAGTLTSAAAILIPLSFWLETPLGVLPSWTSIGALAVNAIIATALGFIVYFRLLRTIGSVSTASVGYLKPAIGVLIGWAFMTEHVTWKTAIGLAAILVGVAFINRKEKGGSFPLFRSQSITSNVIVGSASAGQV
jgi:drug/metabolite transporter (DMT)-like permease